MHILEQPYELPYRYNDYKAFNETHESWLALRNVSILYSCYLIVLFILRWRYYIVSNRKLSGTVKIAQTLFLVLNLFLLVLLWALVYFKKTDTSRKHHTGKTIQGTKSLGNLTISILQNVFVVGMTFTLGFWLLFRLAEGQCASILSIDNFTCNPFQDEFGLPIESVLGLMLVPLTFCVVLRGTSFRMQLVTWAVTIAFIISTAAFVNIQQNLPYIFFFGPTSFVVMCECERQNQAIFEITRKLSQLLEENERLTAEAHASELRLMVGNVAHDLKTVSGHHTYFVL